MAMYDVVVADVRAPRDGRFIEKLGTYNPNVNPAAVDIDDERAFKWVMDGAQPTDTVRSMLSLRGLMLKKHLQIGVNKGAISQEEADKKFEAWKEEKDGKIQGEAESLAAGKAAEAQARLAAETKVKEARAEALKKRDEEAAAAAPAPAPEEEATPAEEGEAAAPATDEVAAEAPTSTDAPEEGKE